MLSESVVATIHPGLLARARQLARSFDEADELLQEAYVLALTSDVVTEASPVAFVAEWMRTTLKNLYFQRGRAGRPGADVEVLLMAGIPVGDRHGESLLELPLYAE